MSFHQSFFDELLKLAAKRTDGALPIGSHIKRQMDLDTASLSRSKKPQHQMFPGGRQLDLPFDAPKRPRPIPPMSQADYAREQAYMRSRNRQA